jgi:hypothetical protein
MASAVHARRWPDGFCRPREALARWLLPSTRGAGPRPDGIALGELGRASATLGVSRPGYAPLYYGWRRSSPPAAPPMAPVLLPDVAPGNALSRNGSGNAPPEGWRRGAPLMGPAGMIPVIRSRLAEA